MEKDPVCGMDVDLKIALTAVYGGKTYYFCSTGCRTQFEANPSQFLSK